MWSHSLEEVDLIKGVALGEIVAQSICSDFLCDLIGLKQWFSNF